MVDPMKAFQGGLSDKTNVKQLIYMDIYISDLICN